MYQKRDRSQSLVTFAVVRGCVHDSTLSLFLWQWQELLQAEMASLEREKRLLGIETTAVEKLLEEISAAEGQCKCLPYFSDSLLP